MYGEHKKLKVLIDDKLSEVCQTDFEEGIGVF